MKKNELESEVSILNKIADSLIKPANQISLPAPPTLTAAEAILHAISLQLEKSSDSDRMDFLLDMLQNANEKVKSICI